MLSDIKYVLDSLHASCPLFVGPNAIDTLDIGIKLVIVYLTLFYELPHLDSALVISAVAVQCLNNSSTQVMWLIKYCHSYRSNKHSLLLLSWGFIGVNISERKSGTERTKKRKKRELLCFPPPGAQLIQ